MFRPSITAVMVTGKTTERYPLAAAAVRSFCEQDYKGESRLVIVNDNSQPLFEGAAPQDNILEIRVLDGKQRTLGELRNIGLEAAACSQYMVQWDDDDFSLSCRLAWQVDNTLKDTASIFRWQVQYDLFTGQCFAGCGRESAVSGFAGTMLLPVAAAPKFKAAAKGEDTYFLQALRRKTKLRVLSNKPEYFLRLYHGHNTWHHAHVMRRRSGSRNLNARELGVVSHIIKTQYSWAACNNVQTTQK